MPKNLNTIERSERIRIGKNVPDEQAINTVLINASNSVVEAPISGFYVSPIRYDTEAEARKVREEVRGAGDGVLGGS